MGHWCLHGVQRVNVQLCMYVGKKKSFMKASITAAASSIPDFLKASKFSFHQFVSNSTPKLCHCQFGIGIYSIVYLDDNTYWNVVVCRWQREVVKGQLESVKIALMMVSAWTWWLIFLV